MTTPHGSSQFLSSFSSPPINMTPPLPPASSASGSAASACSSAAGAGDTSKEKSAKKNRCEHGDCRAKLGLLGFDCKCTGKYCGKHRYPDQHDCAYNFRADAGATLQKQLVTCTADKLGGDRI